MIIQNKECILYTIWCHPRIGNRTGIDQGTIQTSRPKPKACKVLELWKLKREKTWRKCGRHLIKESGTTLGEKHWKHTHTNNHKHRHRYMYVIVCICQININKLIQSSVRHQWVISFKDISRVRCPSESFAVALDLETSSSPRRWPCPSPDMSMSSAWRSWCSRTTKPNS